jgi:FMN phosphatase YigB (HAD superfamily)
VKIRYFALFLLLCASLEGTHKQIKTVYISKTFATEKKAQEALSSQGFFLFDIHGVLFENKGKYLTAFSKVKNKKKFVKQGVKALFSKKARNEYKKRAKEGNKITERKFDSIKHYKHLHNELIDFSNNIFSPHKQMYRLLTELKGKGYPLYLCSNIGNTTLERLISQHPEFFTVMTDRQNTINRTATTTGTFVWKPRPEAFREALATIEKIHQPHLAIFVDDQIENVRAAHNVGLNAIHFTSYPRFFQDISTLLKF